MSSWHSKPLPRLLEELDVRPGGLSQHQAEERLRRAGPNELEPPPQAGLLGRLLEQPGHPGAWDGGDTQPETDLPLLAAHLPPERWREIGRR